MVEQRHADEGSHGQGTALKRRGILAAAAVVVAGIVAKQAAEPVLAATLTLDADNASAANTNIHGPGAAPPWVAAFPISPVFSVQGTAPSNDAIAAKTTGVGGAGGAAFYGETTNGFVLRAVATGAGIPVNADTQNGSAVVGTTVNGFYGIFGSTQNGISGVRGSSQSVDTGSTGVTGAAGHGIGVYGVTSGTGVVAGVYGLADKAYGIIGNTTAAGYSSLTGIASTPGVAALAATSTNASAYAAYFSGSTVVQGDFVAFGGSKSAAVPDASGQHRLVYCVESPEAWFEDFGEATLVNGKAAVTLDPVFAQIVHTDAYHVFLTEYGATNHVFVASRSRTGFVVEAEKAGAVGRFSYRIVAKRKDSAGERLAKFEPPKINHPDPDKLPKPEPPRAAPSPLPSSKP